MKRYLSLKKRPTAKNAPFVSGSPSSKKSEEKDRKLMDKLSEWKNLSK